MLCQGADAIAGAYNGMKPTGACNPCRGHDADDQIWSAREGKFDVWAEAPSLDPSLDEVLVNLIAAI